MENILLSHTGTTPMGSDTDTKETPASTNFPQTPAAYQKIGWRIFPVTPGTKEPLVKQWQDGSYVGSGMNIGVVTGQPSGLVVLDVDAGHDGWQSLKDMEAQHGRLPETLRSVTARGGAHFFFRHPGGREVRNGARIYGKPGLDVRGDGGYVVVPPSSITGAGAYHWDIESPLQIADAPEWVITHGEHRVRTQEMGPDVKNPPGTHHDAMVRVAGSLRHFGTPPDMLEKFLLEYNATKNEPPCPEQEVIDLARDMAKRYPQSHRPETPARGNTLSIPASEFVSMQVKQTEWLVRGIWPEAAIGFVAGAGKSFKSFLTLELGYSLASGADFLGRFKVAESRKVLLVQQESALGAYQVRVSNMSKRLGSTENLFIVSNKHLSLENKVDLERLENEIARVQPALVILDPLASFIHGDENSAQHMGEVVGTLRKLRDDHGCAICIVHHNRKDGTAMRGSTAIFNAFEVLVKMERTQDRDALTSEVSIELKEGEGPLPFLVHLDSRTTALVMGDPPPPEEPGEPEIDPYWQQEEGYDEYERQR